VQARTELAQRLFLEAYATTANISYAAKAAGIRRKTMYDWQEKYDDFCSRMAEAREEAYDKLEHEALRRAVEGVQRKRPIIVGREIVDYEVITEYSDRLLEVLLKARRPDVFREKTSIEHSGPNGQPIAIDIAEQRSALASRIASLTARAGAATVAERTV